jgi:hypothetical protein
MPNRHPTSHKGFASELRPALPSIIVSPVSTPPPPEKTRSRFARPAPWAVDSSSNRIEDGQDYPILREQLFAVPAPVSIARDWGSPHQQNADPECRWMLLWTYPKKKSTSGRAILMQNLTDIVGVTIIVETINASIVWMYVCG